MILKYSKQLNIVRSIIYMYCLHYLTCHTFVSPHAINNYFVGQVQLTGQIKSTIPVIIIVFQQQQNIHVGFIVYIVTDRL